MFIRPFFRKMQFILVVLFVSKISVSIEQVSPKLTYITWPENTQTICETVNYNASVKDPFSEIQKLIRDGDRDTSEVQGQRVGVSLSQSDSSYDDHKEKLGEELSGVLSCLAGVFRQDINHKEAKLDSGDQNSQESEDYIGNSVYSQNSNLKSLSRPSESSFMKSLGEVTLTDRYPGNEQLGRKAANTFLAIVASQMEFAKSLPPKEAWNFTFDDRDSNERVDSAGNIATLLQVNSPSYFEERKYSIPSDGNRPTFISLPESFGNLNDSLILSVVLSKWNPFTEDTLIRTTAGPVLSVILESKETGHLKIPENQTIALRIPWEQSPIQPTSDYEIDTIQIRTKPLGLLQHQDFQVFKMSLLPNAIFGITITTSVPDLPLLVVLKKEIYPIPNHFCEPFRTLTGTYIKEPSDEMFRYPVLVFQADVENDIQNNTLQDYYLAVFPKVAEEEQQNITVKFSVLVTRIVCIARDENGGTWSEEGCTVAGITQDRYIGCACSHLSVFSVAQMNVETSRLLSSEYLVLILLKGNVFGIVLLGVCLTSYTILLIILCVNDEHESKNYGLHIMAPIGDEFSRYYYLISVYTGNLLWPTCMSTTANISIQIFGALGSTQPLVIRENVLKAESLKNSGLDSFLIATANDLGQLQSLNLWRDNSGSSPDWHCRRITIQCLNTKRIYDFLVNTKLSLQQGYSLFIHVNAAKPEDLQSFPEIFRINLYDLFSRMHSTIGMCKKSSGFWDSRANVLSCEYVGIFLKMMLYFYFIEGRDPYHSYYDLSSGFGISWEDLKIAIFIRLLSKPVTLVLGFMFRYAKPRRMPTLFMESAKKKFRVSNFYIFGKTELEGGNHIEIHPTYDKRPAFPDQSVPFSLPPTDTLDMENWLAHVSPNHKASQSVSIQDQYVRQIESGLGDHQRRENNVECEIKKIRKAFPFSFGFSGKNKHREVEQQIDHEIQRNEHTIDTILSILRSQESCQIEQRLDKINYPSITVSGVEIKDKISKKVDSGNENVTNEHSSWTYFEKSYLFLFLCSYPPLRHKGLPHWSRFVAWASVVLIIIGSSCVLVYKSREGGIGWKFTLNLINAMLIGILVLDPIFIFCYALVESLLSNTVPPFKDRRFQILDLKALETRLAYPLGFKTYDPLSTYSPLSVVESLLIKTSLTLTDRAKVDFISLILHLTLLIIIIPVTYSNFSTYDYILLRHIHNMFSWESEVAGDEYVPWTEVSNPNEFYDYFYHIINETLFPSLDLSFMGDINTVLVGVPRFHQFRISSDSPCTTESQWPCFSEGTISFDTKSYLQGWVTPNNLSLLIDEPWIFEPEENSNYKDHGYMRNYPGGGYVALLGFTREASISVMDYLRENAWVDNKTRGIFFEIGMYNPNVNGLMYTNLRAEISAAGKWHTSARTCPLILLSPSHLFTDEEFIAIVAVLLGIMCFIAFLKLCIQIQCYRNDRRIMVSEWILLVLTIASVAVGVKHIFVELVLRDELTSGNTARHIAMDDACAWDQWQQDVLGVTFSFGIVMLWQFLYHTRPQFYTLIMCLRSTRGMLLAQGIVLFGFLLNFAIFGYFVFGSEVFHFRTVSNSFLNLFQETVVYYSIFQQVQEAQPVWGHIYELLFTPFFAFILLSMFVGLINLGCTEARRIAQERNHWISYTALFQKAPPLTLNLKKDQHRILPVVHPARLNAMNIATSQFLQDCLETSEFQRFIKIHQTAKSMIHGSNFVWVPVEAGGKRKREEDRLQNRIHVMKLLCLRALKQKKATNIGVKEVDNEILFLRLFLLEQRVEGLNVLLDSFGAWYPQLDKKARLSLVSS